MYFLWDFAWWRCGLIVLMLAAAASASRAAASSPNITTPSEPTKPKLKKCCPISHFFNVSQRTCQPKQNATASAWENLAELIDLDNRIGSPECQYGEALADVLAFANDSIIDENGEFHFKVSWIPSDVTNVCVDAISGEDEALLIQFCAKPSLVCKHGPCIPKCCQLSEDMADMMTCNKSVEGVFLPKFHERVEIPGHEPELRVIDVVAEARRSFAAGHGIYQMLFAQVLGFPSCHQKIMLGDPVDLAAGYYITRDGYLNTPEKGIPERHHALNYCLETVFPNMTEGQVIPIVCYNEQKPELALFDILLVAALIVSCFFLAATLLTYAVLPSLQNLHGKTLMANVTSLLTAYILLVVVQVNNVTSDSPACKALGFCMLFAFLSAFSWLNIMCIDIWWTFGAVRSSSSSRRRARNRFRAYCIYAWGFPAVLTAAGICVELLAEDDLPWKPALGAYGCWFSYDTHGSLIFFYGPVVGQLLINLTLFVLTVRYCAKVRSEIARFQDSQYSIKTRKMDADKRKLGMCAKLFVVMGVTWAIEVISSQYGKLDGHIQFIVDAPNSFRGVIIFCIFVLKRRVLHALRARFDSCCGKNIAGSTLGGNTVALALASESSPSTRSSIRIDDRLTVMRKTPSNSTLCADVRGRLSPHGSFINLNPDRNNYLFSTSDH